MRTPRLLFGLLVSALIVWLATPVGAAGEASPGAAQDSGLKQAPCPPAIPSILDLTPQYPPTPALDKPATDTKPAPGLCDRMWVQVMSGAVFSPIRGLGPHDVPSLDLAPTDVRLGIMFDHFCHEEGWFRGVTELIVEMNVVPVIHGYGEKVIGPAALLRYDFVQPNKRLIPYIQAGAGIAYNDLYKDHSQIAVGQAQEFTLHGGAGAHYLISPKFSIDAEADYLHISNAGLATRNAGVNAVGGMVGFTYYFRKCPSH